MKIILIVLIFFTAACTTTLPKLDPTIKYQRDLRFKVESWSKGKWGNELKFEGVGVISFAEKLKVTLYAVGKVDMMVMSSCHREIKVANPKSSWWSKGHSFEFSPVKDIETNKPCSIQLGVYEKSKGRHGWGMLAIESSQANMSSVTTCNGVTKSWRGTSFCQAKKGLIQLIYFKNKVETTMYGDCRIKIPEDGKSWEYSMPSGKCILYFFDSTNENLEHVHYMYGYETIPIRGVDGGSYEDNKWGKEDSSHPNNERR